MQWVPEICRTGLISARRTIKRTQSTRNKKSSERWLKYWVGALPWRMRLFPLRHYTRPHSGHRDVLVLSISLLLHKRISMVVQKMEIFARLESPTTGAIQKWIIKEKCVASRVPSLHNWEDRILVRRRCKVESSICSLPGAWGVILCACVVLCDLLLVTCRAPLRQYRDTRDIPRMTINTRCRWSPNCYMHYLTITLLSIGLIIRFDPQTMSI